MKFFVIFFGLCLSAILLSAIPLFLAQSLPSFPLSAICVFIVLCYLLDKIEKTESSPTSRKEDKTDASMCLRENCLEADEVQGLRSNVEGTSELTELTRLRSENKVLKEELLTVRKLRQSSRDKFRD